MLDAKARKLLQTLAKGYLALVEEGEAGDNTSKMAALQVWDVLTALRGPDNDNVVTKIATTGLIRREFLRLGNPRLDLSRYESDHAAAAVYVSGFMVSTVDSDVNKKQRSLLATSDNHFAQHVRRAFATLEMLFTVDE